MCCEQADMISQYYINRPTNYLRWKDSAGEYKAEVMSGMGQFEKSLSLVAAIFNTERVIHFEIEGDLSLYNEGEL